MNRGRFSEFLSVVVTGVIAINGLPSLVLADIINTPAYYSVQSDLSYEITTNITSSWINHESIDLVLTNTGNETIHNWYLTFNTPYSIDNIWNGSLYETDGNGTYTITSNGWNQDIHTGESVTVGITFSSDTEEDLSVDPEWYLLNTQATVVDGSQYTLEYTEYSAWETGFTGQLTLTPQVDCQHWELSFGSNREITAVSSAVIINEGENNYAITHDENNMRLFAGTAYNFGIQGVNTEDPLDMSNVELTVVDLAYHLTDDEDANGVPDYFDFIGGGSIVDPTPTPTPVPTDVPTETPTSEPTGTETPTPTEEPTPTPIIDYESDQDLDGLPDYTEDQLGTDPLKADTDDDLLTDYIEVMIGYDPTNPDTDNNGITDGNEDCDNDGLSNAYELNLGTNPVMEDTDCDRLSDGDEINIYGTDPLVPDSDGDGICDGDEVSMGKNPSDPTDGATRISQSLTQEINNAEDPAITSVTVTADLAGKIDRVLDIRDYYNIDVYSTDVYGRIGSPINFECDEEFDSATIVIHYDETQLINTPENSLGVLWYDEENNIYELQEQAVVDTANNQITLEVDHFSTYVLVNRTLWLKPPLPNYYGYLYYPHVMVLMNDIPGSYTVDSYEDQAWADFQAEHGEDFVRLNTVYSGDFVKASGECYYIYEWFAIDTTDVDGDCVPDFMETLGVLGSNHHIYYSDIDPDGDSDGDTLSDSVEYGDIFLLGMFNNHNQIEKYKKDIEGPITAIQNHTKFDYFVDILSECTATAVACILSNPKSQDSDGDTYNDYFDLNPMIPAVNYENYLIIDDMDIDYSNIDYINDHFSYHTDLMNYDFAVNAPTNSDLALYFYMSSIAAAAEPFTPSAALMLQHYLQGTGSLYNVNMRQLIYIPENEEADEVYNYIYRTFLTNNPFTVENQSVTATYYYYYNLVNVMLFAQSVLKDGESITVRSIRPETAYTITDTYQGVELDWLAALGAGGSSACSLASISRIGDNFVVEYRYCLYDTYDWSLDTSFLEGILPQDKSMHDMLHTTGLAREFNVYGEFTNEFVFNDDDLDRLRFLVGD